MFEELFDGDNGLINEFIDCLKYLLLPRFTEAEKLEFGFDLESLECDHWML